MARRTVTVDTRPKTYRLLVTYKIPRTDPATTEVTITEGVTTVHDIPTMIAMREKVGKNAIFIKLIQELQ